MAETNGTSLTEVYLSATKYIDHQHPSIVSLAKEIIETSLNSTTTERAILVHNYVRDRIPFGWSGRFWNESASEVIKTGRGFCNTKSSLFAALLRAVGIPCRLQFVDINTQILYGLIDPRIPYELHTYTEVFIMETQRWCGVDSYIVDAALVSAAKEKLLQENRIIGYGIHRDGQCDWNGVDDSFVQYVTNSELNKQLEQPLTLHAFGTFADIGAFYAAANQHGVHNRLDNFFLKLLFPLLIIPGNRAAEYLRKNEVI